MRATTEQIRANGRMIATHGQQQPEEAGREQLREQVIELRA